MFTETLQIQIKSNITNFFKILNITYHNIPHDNLIDNITK